MDLPDGTGYQTATSGRADDADNSDGLPTKYTPRDASRSCMDMATIARSIPANFRQIGAEVSAKVGNNPDQPLRRARASSDNKAKSTLQVHQNQTLDWSIDTEIFCALNGDGTGEVQVHVEIFDSAGRLVGSTAGHTYGLKPNAADPRKIDITMDGTAKGTMGNPSTWPDSERGPLAPIKLTRGIYTVRLELFTWAEALEGTAKLTVTSTANFK